MYNRQKRSTAVPPARRPRPARRCVALIACATTAFGVAGLGGVASATPSQVAAQSSSGPVLTWGQAADPGSLWNATDFNATDGAPIMSLVNQGLLSLHGQ